MTNIWTLVRRGLLLLGLTAGSLLGVMLVRTASYGKAGSEVDPAPRAAIPEGAAGRLAGAIRIPTVSREAGGIDGDAFRALHAYLRAAFPRTHAELRREVVAGYSLLYTWPGSDPSLTPILLLGHLDVVPVEPGTESQWQEDPFGGRVADGFIWGRGAIDNKSAVVGILEAIELLISEGFRPERTVHLAFGHDEEAGGRGGAKVIAELLRSRGVELEMVLDEGGVIADGVLAGLSTPVALVGIAEKGFVSVDLRTRAAGGHSSLPPAETAIGILASAMARLEKNPMEARLDGATRQLFERIGPAFPFVQRFIFANLWLSKMVVTSKLEAGPATNAMIRTTAAATLIQGGTKDNVLPTQARAVVNFRILPGDSVAGVLEHVRRTVDDPRVEVTIGGRFSAEPSAVSSTQSESFRRLERAIGRALPGVLVAPYQVVVATDSRYFEDLSGGVFRFLPIPMTPEDLKRMHGVNERIEAARYEDAIRFYRQLLLESTVRVRPDDRQPGRKEVPMDHKTMQKGHAHHDVHAGHHDQAPAGELMIRTEPREALADQTTTLRLMIHGPDGRMVKDFEIIHEQKIHLIIVREGLDQFGHIHPTVDAAGNLSAEFRFPVGGKYRLFADFKPQGQPQSLAIGQLEVGGPSSPAPRLSPNVPGRVRGDGLEADVAVTNAKAGASGRISFSLLDAEGRPVRDLQPYLGAMGHLVVISADGKEYVHAHPGEDAAEAGRIGFDARFAKPGVYKGWGQFRRGGKINTLPLVLGVE
jgi:carboxypeptidase PM20D1